jgi:outer membrane lipoprotein SlyB
MKTLQALAGALTIALLAACQQSSEESSLEADPADGPNPPAAEQAPAPAKKAHHPQLAMAPRLCSTCGVVDSIEKIRQAGEGSGAGAVIGAIVGGVIGHQFGKGRGQDVATAAGAVGGAVAGHESEKQIRADTFYRVSIRMDDGRSRTIDVKDTKGLFVGAKVRVNGSTIEPMGGGNG